MQMANNEVLEPAAIALLLEPEFAALVEVLRLIFQVVAVVGQNVL